MRPEHLKSASILAANKPHGTRLKYMGGCRCLPCRASNSRYETERAALRKQGLSNGITSAKRAHRHIRKLALQGVGRRTISELTGISPTIIMMIKNGTRKNIRMETERRILAVDKEAARGSALIKAGPTWSMINRLYEAGFTPVTLARRLGLQTRIQFNHSRITAITAQRVKRLYDLIFRGVGVMEAVYGEKKANQWEVYKEVV